MAIYTYMDWCPVPTVPFHITEKFNVIEITKAQYANLDQKLIETQLFNDYEDIVSYKFISRLDGFFIFRIKTKNTLEIPIMMDISAHISNFIKKHLGHKHEFHKYYSPYYEPSSFIDKTISPYLKDFFLRIKNDKHFLVYPIQILENNKSIDTLISPELLNKIKATPNRDNKFFSENACLLLHSYYSEKKQKFLNIYREQSTLKLLSLSLLLSVIVLFISYIFLYIFPIFPSEASFIIAVTSFLIVYLYLINRRPALIHKAIGYFNYIDIYSKIVSNLFEESEYKTADIGFSNAISCLEAKAKVEEENVRNQRYILSIFFALTALSIGIIRLDIMLESNPEKKVMTIQKTEQSTKK